MASGWANDDAVNEQINSTIEDAIARARGEIPRGESLDECEECGAPIPQARREAIPVLKEWNNAGRRPVTVLSLGCVVIIVAANIVGIGMAN